VRQKGSKYKEVELLGIVVHACNSSLAGRDIRTLSKPAQSKVVRPFLKTKTKNESAGCAQHALGFGFNSR
jgi:hypothetical protein